MQGRRDGLAVTFDLHDIREAARLIAFGLARIEPAENVDYRGLIGRYSGEGPFRSLVDTVAEGMTLTVVACAVGPGAVLAPAGAGDEDEEPILGRASPFAPLSEDLRRAGLPATVRDRQLWTLGLLAVCYCAFPTAQALSDDDQLGQVDPARADQVLRDLCLDLDRRVSAAVDPPHDEPNLERVWRAYVNSAEVGTTKDTRAHLAGTRALINRVCQVLQQLRCLKPIPRVTPTVYASTPKFQVQVRELAALPYWAELSVAAERLAADNEPR
jgi:hypothetical protein